jgi:hypothetical protein
MRSTEDETEESVAQHHADVIVSNGREFEVNTLHAAVHPSSLGG